MARVTSKNSAPNGSALGFEATLWSAAEKLKGNMDAGEYKHVVLGLMDDPDYIRKEIIDEALTFIENGMRAGEKVLVHCNQGESRSPSIGLLYLAARTNGISSVSLPAAETDFRRIYPHYNPKAGMRGFLLRHWNDYVPSSSTKL